MTRVRLVAVIGLCAGILALALILRRPLGVAPGTGSKGAASPQPSASAAGGQTASRRTSVSDSPPKAGVTPLANANDSSRTSLLGSVVAPTQASLSVRVPARIRDVFAREGDTVRAGQTLIALDASEFAAQEQTAVAGEEAARAQIKKARAGLSAQQAKANADVDTARGGLRQAQTRLQQATLARQAAADEQKADLRAALAGVRKAQIALDRAQETLRGLEELSKVGGVSRSDLEGARTQERIAQSDLDTARAQVERAQAGSGGLPYRVATAQKDVDAAQSAVQQASDGVKTAQEARRQAVKVAEQDVHAAQAALDQAVAGTAGTRLARAQAQLNSPIGGLVTSVSARRGETAQPGTSLATVVSLTGLRVDALVPARLLTLFRSGQGAGVSVDTAPGRVFSAVVNEIAHIAEPDGRTFRVKFRLLGTPPLLPGQTARIKVLTTR